MENRTTITPLSEPKESARESQVEGKRGRKSSQEPRPEKRKNKSEKKPSETPGIKFGRGVETLFRNAYRLQLDLTTLADGKANIMLSITSMTFTVMILAGSFVASWRPWLLIPMGIFLLTSVGAMIFAILAAQPRAKNIRQTREEMLSGDADLLYFKNFSKVSKEEYSHTLEKIYNDQTQIYSQMSRTLYGLGITVDRKFRRLKISYSIFLFGLVTTVIVFLILSRANSAQPTLSLLPIDDTAKLASTAGMLQSRAFKEIYEPSSVQQLPDGRLLIAEDEGLTFSIVSTGSDGMLSEMRVPESELIAQGLDYADDLEALAADGRGYVYAITSHSRKRDGTRSPARERLLRIRFDGSRVVEAGSVDGLLAMMVKAYGFLEPAERFPDARDIRGFNIEGLSFDQGKSRLHIGLRTPLIDGKAVIVTIENPDAMFDQQAAPVFSDEPHLLDLGGGGIRGMDYVHHLGGSLLIAQKPNGPFRLWLWREQAGDELHEVLAPDLLSFGLAEGIAVFRGKDSERLLIVIDDGNTDFRQPGHYFWLDYGQLVIR
jgi:hypothetical protein